MSNKANDIFFESLIEQIDWSDKIKDNMFDADHRNEMLRRYEYTDAGLVKIQDLV